ALHARFVRAVADREFDSLASYFAPDATIDMRTHGPKQGADEIAAHFAHMVTMPLVGAGYILSSPEVTVAGDEADGRWTWHRLYSSADIAGRAVRVWGVWEEGRYDCRYIRLNGEWKFAYMRFRIVRPDADPEGAPLPPRESS
ncbi:MAG TPA: nuclear transport factor 2 family protein, partial [Pseudolysinimonas sp.]|nr:nuclear transport factor 2 family protein [Pseudolysinimonas sp.]